MKIFKAKRKKKKNIIKYFCFVLIIFISFFSMYKSLFNKYLKKKITNELFINYLLDYSRGEINKKSYNNIFSNKFLNPYFLTNYNFNFFTDVQANNEQSDEEYNYTELSLYTSHFEDPNKDVIANPTIYIYNTHQLENYDASYLSSYDLEPNVLMASYLLKEELNDLGINTIVEENDITEFLRINAWKYSYSYKASRYYLDDAFKKNPTLNYFIDLHRDSVKRSYTTITINDKNYAKILFLIGTDNINYNENLNLANKVSELINSKYPGLSKGILKKGGKGVNGIYNQDFSPNCMLIEVGGVENTIDEVANTIDALSNVLYEIIRG